MILAAAKVGGIHANNVYPADFIYQNLMMQANVIEAAFQNGVQKLLFLGSSCIYPKLAPQPMPESCLLTGPLEPTNRPYALAKIAAVLRPLAASVTIVALPLEAKGDDVVEWIDAGGTLADLIEVTADFAQQPPRAQLVTGVVLHRHFFQRLFDHFGRAGHRDDHDPIHITNDDAAPVTPPVVSIAPTGIDVAPTLTVAPVPG